MALSVVTGAGLASAVLMPIADGTYNSAIMDVEATQRDRVSAPVLLQTKAARMQQDVVVELPRRWGWFKERFMRSTCISWGRCRDENQHAVTKTV